MIEQAISEFGKQVGLKNLAFNSRGLICMGDKSSEVFLERIDNGVLAYITQEVSYVDADTYCALMSMCSYENKSVAYMNPGVTQDGKLLLAMRFDEDQASGSGLKNGILFMREKMKTITQ